MREFARRTPQEEAVEHERSREKTSRPLTTGVTLIREIEESLREARFWRLHSRPGEVASLEDEALKYACRLLRLPQNEHEPAAADFSRIMNAAPDIAKRSLTIFRQTGILTERSLRQFLGLPSKGRIFPKA